MPPAVGAALLSGCGMPEARLRAGLVNAGLPPPLAACMAGRMADRLSLMQLRRIGDLPQARGIAFGRRIPAPRPRAARPPDPERDHQLGGLVRDRAGGLIAPRDAAPPLM